MEQRQSVQIPACLSPELGFSWIPAGWESPVEPAIGKRKVSSPNPSENKRGCVEIIQGDQVLTVMTGKAAAAANPRDYDELVHLSLANADPQARELIEGVLGNTWYQPEPVNLLPLREMGIYRFGDSGGFQIKVGLRRPRACKVIQTMNNYYDYGFVLDVPPRPGIDHVRPELYRALAMATRENCKIMQAERNPKLGMFGIVHGPTADLARMWIDTTAYGEFVGWGVSCQHDIVSGFRAALILYHEYGVRWVHVLGISSPQAMCAMAWLSRYLRVTCDSSAQLGGTKHRKYRWCTPAGRIKASTFRKMGKSCIPGLPLPLPCGCPVCKHIKRDVLHDAGSTIGSLIAVHNMYQMASEARTINELAHRPGMTLPEFKRKLAGFAKPDLYMILDYIEDAMHDCLGIAEQRMLRARARMRRSDVFQDAPIKRPSTDGYYPPSSNVEVLPYYLNLDDPAVHAEMHPTIQSWWKRNQIKYRAAVQMTVESWKNQPEMGRGGVEWLAW